MWICIAMLSYKINLRPFNSCVHYKNIILNTMGYHSATRKKDILSFADTLMSPRDVILAKTNHALKGQACLYHLQTSKMFTLQSQRVQEQLPETMVFRDQAQSRNDAGQGRQNDTSVPDISLTQELDSTVIAVNGVLHYIIGNFQESRLETILMVKMLII